MQGLMQQQPLAVTTILDYAAKFHGDQQVGVIMLLSCWVAWACWAGGGVLLGRWWYSEPTGANRIRALGLSFYSQRLPGRWYL